MRTPELPRTRRPIALAVVAALALAVAAAGRPVATAAQNQPGGARASAPSGLIAGRIVDPAGAPVAAAVVAISRPAPASAPRASAAQPQRVLTDDEGRFFFANLAAGQYTLTASKPGWLGGAFGRKRPDGQSVPFELGEGERRADVTITIWRAAVVTGLVSDDNGDPLVNVEVRAMRQTYIAGRPQSEAPLREKTDDRGIYRFSALTPGSYLVAVLATVVSEPPELTGAIHASGARPRPFLQTMTAIGSAPMILDGALGAAGGGRSLVGSLGPIASLPTAEGPWHVYPTTFHPSTTSIASATIVNVVPGAMQSGVDLRVRLTETWRVSGVLTGPDGPAALHAVHLVPAESGDRPLIDVGTAITDAAGAFTFYGVPSGSYIARVVRVPWPDGSSMRLGVVGGTGQIPYIAAFGDSSSGTPRAPAEPLLHASASVTVGSGHVRDLALTMSEGPRIRGHAEFDGSGARPAPAEWPRVVVQLEAANGRMDSTIFPGAFDESGRFTTASAWPGRYLMRPAAPAGWTVKSVTSRGQDIFQTPFDLVADLDDVVVTYTNQARQITGTVRSPDGGSVAGAAVLLFPVDPARWVDYGRTSLTVASAAASSSGAFTLKAPPAGDYFLIAIPDELAGGWQNPERLKALAAVAERIEVRDDVPPARTLQLRRVR
jgi:hypothetical protein